MQAGSRGVAAAWGILGLRRGASLSDVKAQHRKLAVQHHPDRGGSADKMAEVNQAYEAVQKDLEARGTQPHTAPGAPRKPQGAGPHARSPFGYRAQGRRTSTVEEAPRVSNYTTVRVATQRAGAGMEVNTAGLRSIKTLLSKVRKGSDTHGPKLQAKDSAHWGRAYGKSRVPPSEAELLRVRRRSQDD